MHLKSNIVESMTCFTINSLLEVCMSLRNKGKILPCSQQNDVLHTTVKRHAYIGSFLTAWTISAHLPAQELQTANEAFRIPSEGDFSASVVALLSFYWTL